jgi:hypothetical protein
MLQATQQAHAETAVPLEAIWRVQSIPFEYRSGNMYYNCDSLAMKVAAILRAVGAHRSVVVQTRCERGPTNRISARIALATPVPATAENVRAATTFDSKDALVARLHKLTIPTPNDLVRFPASWQPVALTRMRDLKLTLADCDLLRDINEQIFPRIAVRFITNHKLHCGTYSNRIRPKLEIEAFLPLKSSTEPLAQLTRN